MKAFSASHAAMLILSVSLAGCGGTGSGSWTKTVGAFKVGKPYKIDGVYYYPKEDYNYIETGVASWYGRKFHGKRTANGERYDMNALTAAHRTLPMPSIVRVTNLDNGRSMVLRVNDRGPFARARIIDVSRRSAQLLGFKRQGTARVRVEIVPEESRRLAMLAKRSTLTERERISAPPTPPPPFQTEPLPPPGAPAQVAAATVSAANGGKARAAVNGRDHAAPTRSLIEYRSVRPTSLYIQVGAFVDYINAARLRTRLEHIGRARVSEARVGRERFFRVRLGPISTVAVADRVLDRVVASGLPAARLIVD